MGKKITVTQNQLKHPGRSLLIFVLYPSILFISHLPVIEIHIFPTNSEIETCLTINGVSD